ncbi:MAG TPA: glycosyltransferase family 4 protein [Ramlibacter sp.]|nr:glycosyltransferase family 4 protein [Ramlibacter sp.]
MPQNSAQRPQPEPQSPSPTRNGERPYIYIACPWTPVGGGMFKVADYLIQSQDPRGDRRGAQLRPLDTRGAGSAPASLLVLVGALLKIARGRMSGALAGVHVNMAERLSLARKSALILTCKALGVPVVLHLHAAQLHHTYRSFPAPAQRLVRWVFSLPERCVVLGQASADFVTQELKVARERVEVVINGVPQPRLERRRPDGRFRLLFVGNLSERKGVSDLLQALSFPQLAHLPWTATFVGGGDVEGYRAKARQLGLDKRVRFEGWADQARVASLLSEADALALPSHDEGLPLAILEALAHGVAVLCTPVGEIPHVLTDGHNACFVRPGDPASIANGLSRVLGDPALRERLEHNGRALYQQEFSLSRFFANIAAIHQREFGVSGKLPASDATLPPGAVRKSAGAKAEAPRSVSAVLPEARP